MPVNLALLVITVWTVFRPVRGSLITAFLSGLFLDLAKGTPLGISSLVLLVICYLLFLYRRRFDPWHPLFLPLFVFLSHTFASLVIDHWPNWLGGMILVLIALLFRLAVRRLVVGLDNQEIKLKT